jgi:hypothetical protein
MPFITQVLLPKRDNLGKMIPQARFRTFQNRMIDRYRGWTRKGQAEGAWLSPTGMLYMDTHWVYEVGHDTKDIRFWKAEKERLKEEFDQEDIWIVQYEGRQI